VPGILLDTVALLLRGGQDNGGFGHNLVGVIDEYGADTRGAKIDAEIQRRGTRGG
jgi:hypothetical protein